jgi:recombination protein RecT
MTTALAKRTAVDTLIAHKDQFLASLPRDIDRERFFAIALSVMKDEKLAECTDRSKLDSIYRFARLGFDPDPLMGEGYVIPRNCKRRVNRNGKWEDVWEKVASFQPGYRGLTKLARKSRSIADIHAEVVYEGEPFRVYYGTNRRIEHEPCVSVDAEPGAVRAAYVTWKDLASGNVNFHVIDRKRIARARAVNHKEGKESPWDTDEPAMARKTAIIDAAKFWQLSAELAEAITIQEQVDRGEEVPSVIPPSIAVEGEVIEPAHEAPKSELDDFAEYNVPAPESAPVPPSPAQASPEAVSPDIEAEAAQALGQRSENKAEAILNDPRVIKKEAEAFVKSQGEAQLREYVNSFSPDTIAAACDTAKVAGVGNAHPLKSIQKVAFVLKTFELTPKQEAA